MEVGQGRDNNKILNKPPLFESQLPQTWIEADEGIVEIPTADPEFCLFCTFVIKLTNLNEAKGNGDVVPTDQILKTNILVS